MPGYSVELKPAVEGSGAFQLWEKPDTPMPAPNTVWDFWTLYSLGLLDPYWGATTPECCAFPRAAQLSGWAAGNAVGRHKEQWLCTPWDPMGTLAHVHCTSPALLRVTWPSHHTLSDISVRTSMTVMACHQVLSQAHTMYNIQCHTQTVSLNVIHI